MSPDFKGRHVFSRSQVSPVPSILRELQGPRLDGLVGRAATELPRPSLPRSEVCSAAAEHVQVSTYSHHNGPVGVFLAASGNIHVRHRIMAES